MTSMRCRRWRGRVITKLLSMIKILEANDDQGIDIEQQRLEAFDTSRTCSMRQLVATWLKPEHCKYKGVDERKASEICMSTEINKQRMVDVWLKWSDCTAVSPNAPSNIPPGALSSECLDVTW